MTHEIVLGELASRLRETRRLELGKEGQVHLCADSAQLHGTEAVRLRIVENAPPFPCGTSERGKAERQPRVVRQRGVVHEKSGAAGRAQPAASRAAADCMKVRRLILMTAP